MMRLAAADMQGLTPLAEGERGVMITTASVAAFEGQVGQAAYSASKGGVAALTMPAAREFAQFGIRVVCIAPGIFQHPHADGDPRGIAEEPCRLGAVPQGARPSRSVCLACPSIIENSYLNGEVIRLDGRCAWRRADRAQDAGDAGQQHARCVSNGAIAIPAASSITRAILRSSTPATRRSSSAHSA